MISFRQHVVTLVAVFLALAIGIVLGGGPLSDLGRAAPASSRSAAGPAVDSAEGASTAYADAVLTASAARVYAEGLAGSGVAIIAFPGVAESTVEAAAAQVEAAGGSVTTTWQIQETLTDPGERALVDTLGSQLAAQASDPADDPADQRADQRGSTVGAGVPTYERLGELLGLAAATTRTRPDQGGTLGAAISESLSTAGLVTPADPEARRAPRLLVVLGPDTSPADDAVYAGIVAGLTRHAGATVLAADSGDPRLERLREQPVAAAVATVDGLESTAGQVTAVLAFIHWPDTRGGSYGASGADGAVDVQ